MLDPAEKRLAVRARGLTLSETPIEELSLLVFEPLFGDAQAPPLDAPVIWRVVRGPGDTDRETIAPTTLRPYSEEEERAEPTPTATPAPGAPAPGAKPESYRVALDNGWQLLVTAEAPRLGWFRRFTASVADGWLRVRGREPSHPPLVALVVAAEDARALHHLFRTGIAILVAPAS